MDRAYCLDNTPLVTTSSRPRDREINMLNWLGVKAVNGSCNTCGFLFGDGGRAFIKCSMDIENPFIICDACLRKQNPVEVEIGDTVYQQTGG